jgi:phosphoglycerate dehydrogenase-like enzyme
VDTRDAASAHKVHRIAASVSLKAAPRRGLGEPSLRGALADATVLLARNTGTELRPGEPAPIRRARLVQFVTAGVDLVPLGDLAAEVPVACNGGACAEPMAEHALAMVCPAISTYRPADDRRCE